VAELDREGGAEAFHPDVVGGEGGVGAVDLHGVAVRPEDQVDRIDEGAVEIEEESGEGHR